PTRYLAKELGIDNYFAEVLPEDKASLIGMLQKENKKVCFIGDGINDSIALKKADVSISLRGASTIATDTAQLVLMNEGLEQLPFIFELGQEFDKYMTNNIMSSVVPSAITIGGAFFFGFGIITSSVINQLGLLVGLGNSFHPLVKMPQEHEPLAIPESSSTKEHNLIPEKEVVNENTSIAYSTITKKKYQSKQNMELASAN
ncbi:MAG: HAD-IC family P-type ATPase, partial [Saprospiraceae bacterium]